MPTPPLSEERMIEAVQAVREHGGIAAAARALGMPSSTLESRYSKARERGLHLSVGAQDAMRATGLNGLEISSGWRHAYDGDGKKIETVYFSVPKDAPEAQEDVLQRIREAFEGMAPAEPVAAPERNMGELCTLYPLFDVHFGMRAWGRETGSDDYDTNLAVEDLKQAVGDVMAWTPDSAKAIILIGGDFFHADDSTNQTPRSRHPLDVDGRHFKVMETGIAAVSHLIETALHKHQSAYVRVMRGNHDEHSHVALTFALSQRYRNEPRVTVEQEPRDIFMYQHGACMIAAHHGDKAKAQQLVMVLADICPFWSASRHRIVMTGHVHHDQVKEFPGIRWESFRAFCPPDAYGSQFAPRRAMQALTFHADRGLVLRSSDTIQR